MWKLSVCGVIKMQTLTFLSALFLTKFNMRNKIVQCSFTFSHWSFLFAFVEKMGRYFCFSTFRSFHFLLVCWTVPLSKPSTNCDSLMLAQNDDIWTNFPVPGKQAASSTWPQTYGEQLGSLFAAHPTSVSGESQVFSSVHSPWGTGFAVSPWSASVFQWFFNCFLTLSKTMREVFIFENLDYTINYKIK